MNTLFSISSDALPHITYIGLTNTDSDWRHPARTISEYVLYFICSGEMYLEENDKQYLLKRGDVILLEPDFMHRGYQSSRCSYLYAHVSVSSVKNASAPGSDTQSHLIQQTLHTNYSESSLSDRLYSETSLLLPKRLSVPDDESYQQLTHTFTSAIRIHQMKHVYYKTQTSCRLMEIFCMLSTIWMDLKFSNSQMNISQIMHEKTNALLDYLHASYSQKITGDSLEALFSINFDYLNRAFKKRTNKTIFSYLNTLRLEQAKQLLLTTELPLSEIASKTGFSDQYYFSRVFKKNTGITPSKCRK